MRTLLRPFLFVCVLALGLPAGGADESAKTTPRIRQAVADKLPKFTPPPPADAPADAERADALPPLADGESILVLPEFRVQEQKIFKPSPDAWLTDGELTRKSIRLAERDMNPLDLALNRWHIPLLTPSFAARARAAYREQQLIEEMERLDRLLKLSADLEIDDEEMAAMRVRRDQTFRITLDLTKRRN